MQQRVHLSSDASSGCWCLLLTCSPAISLYAGRRASATAGALFAFVRAWRGRSNHARQKARQTTQARRKRRPLRSRHGRTGDQKKRTAETAPARSQAARWGQNPADARRAAHRASKRPKAGKNTPQKKHPAKRQIQSPQKDRQTPQQKPRRRIPRPNPPNPKAKLSASTRSTTSSFPATWIPARSSRASAGGSQTTPWRRSRWICSKAQRARSESGRPQTSPPAGQNGRQNAPQPQGGGNGQPRQQSARNGSQSAQRKRQEKSRAQLFLSENAKIKKYEKISQKLLTKPPARCIMYVQSTPKVHTRR